MKLRRTQNPLDLSQQLITNLESRLSEQRQRIARLKMKAQPTQEAEAVLKEFESSLMQLRNHSEIMQNLTTLDRYDAPPSAEDHLLRRRRVSEPLALCRNARSFCILD